MKKQKENIVKTSENELGKINSTLEHIKECLDKPQVIKIDTPLEIKPTPEKTEKKWKQVTWAVILFLLFILPGTWAFYINHKKSDTFKLKSNPIKCSIRYSSRVSVGDEGLIELTVTNLSINPIKEVKASLAFPEVAFIKITSKEETSFIDFDVLSSKETKTKKVNFSLQQSLGKNKMEIKLMMTSAGAQEPPKPFSIKIFCIPHIKLIFRLFFFIFNAVLLPIFIERAKALIQL